MFKIFLNGKQKKLNETFSQSQNKEYKYQTIQNRKQM